MYDSNPFELYKYLFIQLDNRNIGFIELTKSQDPKNYENYGLPSSES
jgi:hypothetical protein